MKGQYSRNVMGGAYIEHSGITKALIQRNRIAYVYRMNRHPQAGRQFITPKAV
ncbi:hypothetical protein [Rhizobium tropici]|uniref:hypothetical protein n=1 Tax=Rhizobium tropici TaxID=398 RepID=UPI0013AFADDD|nr:hypothetical protein [Rhizobium tropici]